MTDRTAAVRDGASVKARKPTALVKSEASHRRRRTRRSCEGATSSSCADRTPHWFEEVPALSATTSSRSGDGRRTIFDAPCASALVSLCALASARAQVTGARPHGRTGSVVDLARCDGAQLVSTDEGAALVGGRWRYPRCARIIEVDKISSPDPDLRRADTRRATNTSRRTPVPPTLMTLSGSNRADWSRQPAWPRRPVVVRLVSHHLTIPSARPFDRGFDGRVQDCRGRLLPRCGSTAACRSYWANRAGLVHGLEHAESRRSLRTRDVRPGQRSRWRCSARTVRCRIRPPTSFGSVGRTRFYKRDPWAQRRNDGRTRDRGSISPLNAIVLQGLDHRKARRRLSVHGRAHLGRQWLSAVQRFLTPTRSIRWTTDGQVSVFRTY